MRDWRRPLQGSVALGRDIIFAITKHDIASLAAMISFYALFSLFPALLLIIFGVSKFLPQVAVQHLLLHLLNPYYPAIEAAHAFVQQTIADLVKNGSRVGVVSAITLVWSATSGFIALQQALDTIFESQKPRGFLARRWVAFLMLVLLLALIIGSSLGMAIYSALTTQMHHNAQWMMWYQWLQPVFRVLFPVVLFVTCFILYRFLPTEKIDTTSALLGSFAATLCLDVARQLFVSYAGNVGRYKLIYGGLTAVMLMILWMYIATILMLFGAVIAACLRRPRRV